MVCSFKELAEIDENGAKLVKIGVGRKRQICLHAFLLADLVVRYFFGARVLSHEAYRLLTAAIQIPALD